MKKHSAAVLMCLSTCVPSLSAQPPEPIPRFIRIPGYPRLAQLAHLEGIVHFDVTVDPAGNVVGADLVKGINSYVDQAARDAAWQWKFEGGPGRALLTFQFSLDFEYNPDCQLSPEIWWPSRVVIYGVMPPMTPRHHAPS
jgi:TonB family protein